MRAQLFARFGPEQGLEIEFAEEATIGRGKDNSVLLKSREVSQHHARVFYDPESASYWVEDLASLNGTRLDGTSVSGRERLGGLHVLSFGATAELFFVELASEPEEETVAVQAVGSKTRVDGEAPALPPGLRQPAVPDQTRVDGEVPTLPPGLNQPATLDQTLVDAEEPTLPVGAQAKLPDWAAGAAPGSATGIEEAPAVLPPSLVGGEATADARRRFVLQVPGSAGGRFELREGDNLVGRSAQAQVVLANRELSRRHATLRVAEGRVWLRDEGSRNHTYVADEEISDEGEIAPGTELRFGRLPARLSAAESAGGEE